MNYNLQYNITMFSENKPKSDVYHFSESFFMISFGFASIPSKLKKEKCAMLRVIII